MYKKLFSVILILILGFLSGCNNKKLNEEIKIVAPQGTPLIAVGGLIDEENISIESVSGAAGVKTALVGNDYDIVIAPLNLGVQLFNNGNSAYILDSVIALGNTYVISKSDKQLNDLSDLEGKNILAYSMGGTPDIILQYVLKENNINVNIEYQASLSEVVPFFIQGQYDYILAAEPIITNLKITKGLNLNVLNLQDYTENTIMQAAIFVNPNTEKQESIDIVINKIKQNIEKMNNNTETYVKNIIEKNVYFSDLGETILINSIPNANLDFVKAKNNKEKIESYLMMIGYQLPDEKFYR